MTINKLTNNIKPLDEVDKINETIQLLNGETSFTNSIKSTSNEAFKLEKNSGNTYAAVASRTDTGNLISFGIDSGGENRGIWDSKLNKWAFNITNNKAYALGNEIATKIDLSTKIDGDNIRLYALKAYADNGELLQDADGLAFVKNYAHSTFDKSKFTVVGSPKITEDGVLSSIGLDAWHNYVSCPAISPTKSLDITILAKMPTTAITHSNGLLTRSGNDGGIYFQLNYNSGGSYYQIALGSTEQADISGWANLGAIDYNKDVLFNIKWDGSVYKVLKSLDYGKTVTQIGSWNSSTPIGADTYNIGLYASELLGIDLKYLSVIVDGVPKFVGNKTGIDTIKDNNYTVVGTPTISADGIASGFSTSNYLYKSNAITVGTNSSFVFRGTFKPTALGNADTLFEINDLHSGNDSNNNKLIIRTNSAGKINGFYSGENVTNTTIDTNLYLSVNTNNDISINTNDGVHYIFTVNGVSQSVTFNDAFYASQYTVTIGRRRLSYDATTATAFQGSIDLNSFKIYVDGDLVYQPCLKIPYTESKTGSKIVDSIYRDRVNDMAEQFGFANYYTLQDEANGNYTVVGSPTISSDFVASGFATNQTNYINVSGTYKFSTTNSFEIDTAFTLSSSSSIRGFLYRVAIDGYAGAFGFAIGVENNKVVVSGMTSETFTIDHTLSLNTPYTLKVKCNNGACNIYVNDTLIGSQFTYIKDISTAYITIGNGTGTNSNPFSFGTIDLKEYKIYTNGQLAYEAVTDPNFTLPQVELYGLIGAKTLRDSYENGINKWYLYSNRDLEQQGSCTSGVEVTLARPFADTNYVLSVPYSAKSATAFTPTQTGDWFAKGKGVL